MAYNHAKCAEDPREVRASCVPVAQNPAKCTPGLTACSAEYLRWQLKSAIPIHAVPYTCSMKFVFASDSFKGTLSSVQTCSLLQEAALEAFPSAECVSVPIADGGGGTLDALAVARPGQLVSIIANNGLMKPIRCKILICGDEAFVESASMCGLVHIPEEDRDPLQTSSSGVGECIAHALYHGCKHITVGLGDSCMNDGGMGCMRALGVRFYDEAGRDLVGNGKNMERIACIDESGLIPQAREATFTLMNDVTNPLLGPTGATYVFGRQKGADDAALERLEAGMRHYADVLHESHPEIDFDTPGYGAAGGLAMGLAVFLGAQIESGVETLLQWVDFDGLLQGADLVVTGEGQLDGQSLRGKVVSGVAAHAHKAGVPVAVICGRSLLDENQVAGLGVLHVIETGAGLSPEEAMARAQETYTRAARSLFASLA